MPMLNDPKENQMVADKLKELHARADQQPVSYIQLFREAMDLVDEQFKRAMAAEARLAKVAAVKAIDCQASSGWDALREAQKIANGL